VSALVRGRICASNSASAEPAEELRLQLVELLHLLIKQRPQDAVNLYVQTAPVRSLFSAQHTVLRRLPSDWSTSFPYSQSLWGIRSQT